MSRRQFTGIVFLLSLITAAILWQYIRPPQNPPSSPDKNLVSTITSPEQKFLLDGPIDINTATIEALEAIPRIGPKLAQRIDEFRSRHGRISSVEELLEVNGIGPKILTVIKPYLMMTNR